MRRSKTKVAISIRRNHLSSSVAPPAVNPSHHPVIRHLSPGTLDGFGAGAGLSRSRSGAHFQAEKRKKQTYRITHPSPIKQYLPREMTTVWPLPVRLKSPRMIAPFEMIVLPPRMIFCGPAMIALRDTLLPVSCRSSHTSEPHETYWTFRDCACAAINTYGLDILRTRVIDRLLHPWKTIS